VVRFLSPELTVVLLPLAFLDAMNPGHAGAYWFESSLVHRAQTLRGQDDKALYAKAMSEPTTAIPTHQMKTPSRGPM
jgi:hypothetical protein